MPPHQPTSDINHQLTRSLINRLEKISADSPWAHQASGVRAALAKTLAAVESSPQPSNHADKLGSLTALGFSILEEAAGQIPGDKPQ